MIINLSPQCDERTLTVEKDGDRLRINGTLFNFGPLPDGASASADVVPSEWVVGRIERVAGELSITLKLPIGLYPEQWQSFPEPLTNVPDGPVDLPVNTRVEVARIEVEGGTNIVTTTYRWHRTNEVQTIFEPKPVEEAPADVDN